MKAWLTKMITTKTAKTKTAKTKTKIKTKTKTKTKTTLIPLANSPVFHHLTDRPTF